MDPGTETVPELAVGKGNNLCALAHKPEARATSLRGSNCPLIEEDAAEDCIWTGLARYTNISSFFDFIFQPHTLAKLFDFRSIQNCTGDRVHYIYILNA